MNTILGTTKRRIRPSMKSIFSRIAMIGQTMDADTAYFMDNIKLFDVSLRDGIQLANPQDYSLLVKQNIFASILTTHFPESMEIGSISNALPIMRDSLDLADYAFDVSREAADTMGYRPPPKLYLLTPNAKGLEKALTHFDRKKYNRMNYSWISSVSDPFQLKNTGKTLLQQKNELVRMRNMIRDQSSSPLIKLYISCIHECPIAGKIDMPRILEEIEYYHSTFPDIDELCLSDTMGTLSFIDYRKLIDAIFARNIPAEKFSLHLHMLPGHANWDEVRQIVWYSLRKGIFRYDVSLLNHGGCAMALDKETHGSRPNLSYRNFKEIIHRPLSK
jgi:hypothetical protein